MSSQAVQGRCRAEQARFDSSLGRCRAVWALTDVELSRLGPMLSRPGLDRCRVVGAQFDVEPNGSGSMSSRPGLYCCRVVRARAVVVLSWPSLSKVDPSLRRAESSGRKSSGLLFYVLLFSFFCKSQIFSQIEIERENICIGINYFLQD